MSPYVQRESIADILVHRGCISTENLAAARVEAEKSESKLEHFLVDKNFVSGADMALCISQYLKMPPMQLSHFSPDPKLLDILPRETMKKLKVVPVCKMDKTLTLALADPFDVVTLDEIHSTTGLEVVAVVSPEKDIEDLLQRFADESSQGLEDILKDVGDGDVEVGQMETEDVSLDEMLDEAEDAPVIRIVNSIMVEGIRKRASDIHIEPMERTLRLRYRIDGMLYETPSPPKALQSAVTSRIKIMSNLDIAERRVPQDGRFRVRAVGKECDIRVSILPTVHGEKVVMRILDKTALAPNLAALGLDPKSYENLQFAISQPHGMMLVTGPTGSGKTTTLYSALQELNQPDVNIITVEDPVEYQLGGINQVQTHSDVGLTFAAGLRSILRQDPDVVMVGEIRDGETASIAVQAALTGHLVLSTLHTNDAAGAIARLVYMGIEPFLLASSLIMTQAQRLYRKVCTACRRQINIPMDALRLNHINPEQFEGVTFYEANGCPKCGSLGYKGRGALMEILLIDDTLRALVLKNANSGEIRDTAIEHGMISLRQAGLNRVADGLTTIDEIMRVTSSE